MYRHDVAEFERIQVSAWNFGKFRYIELLFALLEIQWTRYPIYAVPLVMCGLDILETSYMISAQRLNGPLWFDILAAGSLVVGLLVVGLLAGALLAKTLPSTTALKLAPPKP